MRSILSRHQPETITPGIISITDDNSTITTVHRIETSTETGKISPPDSHLAVWGSPHGVSVEKGPCGSFGGISIEGGTLGIQMAKRTKGKAMRGAVNQGLQEIETLPDLGIAGLVADKLATHRYRNGRRRLIAIAEADHAERTRVATRIKPTAETERKLQPDPIATLLARGSIDIEAVMAAREIQRVYEAICGGMLAKASFATGGGSGNGGDGPRMSERIAYAHARRYMPWANRLSQAYLAGGDPVLEIVIDVVIDGLSCRQSDRQRRWRDGTTSSFVVQGLGLYVQMAGGFVPRDRGEE